MYLLDACFEDFDLPRGMNEKNGNDALIIAAETKIGVSDEWICGNGYPVETSFLDFVTLTTDQPKSRMHNLSFWQYSQILIKPSQLQFLTYIGRGRTAPNTNPLPCHCIIL